MDFCDSRLKYSSIIGWFPLYPSAPGQRMPPSGIASAQFENGFEEGEK